MEIINELAPGRRMRVLLELLCRNFGEWVPTERVLEVVYADDPDGGPLTAGNSIRVMCAQLRGKLAHVGLRVEGKVGAGCTGRRIVWSDHPLPQKRPGSIDIDLRGLLRGGMAL